MGIGALPIATRQPDRSQATALVLCVDESIPITNLSGVLVIGTLRYPLQLLGSGGTVNNCHLGTHLHGVKVTLQKHLTFRPKGNITFDHKQYIFYPQLRCREVRAAKEFSPGAGILFPAAPRN